jgi:predicted RecA/RadA family phage recombinase
MKEAIRIQEGKKIGFTLTGATNVGDVVPLGTGMIGVASTSGLTGEEITLELEGVYEVNAATADVVEIGDLLYFDVTNRVLTIVATNNVRAGRSLTAKAASVAGVVSALINVA